MDCRYSKIFIKQKSLASYLTIKYYALLKTVCLIKVY